VSLVVVSICAQVQAGQGRVRLYVISQDNTGKLRHSLVYAVLNYQGG
jgi:hypothetical protein